MEGVIQPFALNEVLTQHSPGVAGSLVGAADVRQYGALDTASMQGSPDNMSFIQVLMALNPQ